MGLLAGLAFVPAALVPVVVYDSLPLRDASAVSLVVGMFVPAVEAGLALILAFAAFVPRAQRSAGMRWVMWAALGFLAIAFVHGLVE
jgi:hypothetical protein